MHVTSLSTIGFRNLEISKTELSPGLNIIHGNNAQGKTNFLEAIYFCAFGRSSRIRSDGDLIKWGEQAAYIKILSERAGYITTFDACIENRGKNKVKSISLDFVPVRHMKDLFGRMLVVMFAPEDLRLVKAGPAERRRFMDMEICQLSPVYYSELKDYHRALKQRNALLKSLQKKPDKTQRETLSVWDSELVRHGLKIIKTRRAFMSRVQLIAEEIHNNITQGVEHLRLDYKPGLEADIYAKALAKSWDRDIIRGATQEGIHTDDFEIRINNVSARYFGSQGQQRTAALSTKLAEIEIIKQSTGETPILLLDDVLSELDEHRQRFLFQEIKNMQTIITCTGYGNVSGGFFEGLSADTRVMRMENGKIDL